MNIVVQSVIAYVRKSLSLRLQNVLLFLYMS